eukprot:s1898_g3.t1
MIIRKLKSFSAPESSGMETADWTPGIPWVKREMAPAAVPAEVLHCTPSEVDGISRDTEEELRAFGVVLLQRATLLLRLPQQTSITASSVLQRFFFRRSLADFDVRITAAASLLLACKLQGSDRRLKQIIPIFYRLHLRSLEDPVYHRRPLPSLDMRGRDALEMKQAIISVEQQILSELGFGASLLRETPHRHMLHFLRSGALNVFSTRVDLVQSAWNFLNDSACSTLCCEYQPHEIATACIFLAADKLQIQLPSRPPWWNACYTRYEDMMQIAKSMNALYRRPFPRWHPVRRKEAEVPGCLRSPETEEPSPTAHSPREASRSRSPKPAPKRVVRLTVGRGHRR